MTDTTIPPDVQEELNLTFVSQEAAERWLDRPSPYLHGLTPRQELRAGRPERVLAALAALTSGFAS